MTRIGCDLDLAAPDRPPQACEVSGSGAVPPRVTRSACTSTSHRAYARRAAPTPGPGAAPPPGAGSGPRAAAGRVPARAGRWRRSPCRRASCRYCQGRTWVADPRFRTTTCGAGLLPGGDVVRGGTGADAGQAAGEVGQAELDLVLACGGQRRGQQGAPGVVVVVRAVGFGDGLGDGFGDGFADGLATASRRPSPKPGRDRTRAGAPPAGGRGAARRRTATAATATAPPASRAPPPPASRQRRSRGHGGVAPGAGRRGSGRARRGAGAGRGSGPRRGRRRAAGRAGSGCMAAATAAASRGGSPATSGGGPASTRWATAASGPSPKGRRPVPAYATSAPQPKTSAGGPAGCWRSTSGAIQPIDPTTSPVVVKVVAASTGRAMPKSTTHGPPGPSSTFAASGRVDDAAPGGSRSGPGRRRPRRPRGRPAQRARDLHVLAQRRPGHVLGDEVGQRRVGVGVEHGRDARSPSCSAACVSRRNRHGRRGRRRTRADHLDSHLKPGRAGRGRLGQVDGAHPTRAQAAQQPVGPDGGRVGMARSGAGPRGPGRTGALTLPEPTRQGRATVIPAGGRVAHRGERRRPRRRAGSGG